MLGFISLKSSSLFSVTTGFSRYFATADATFLSRVLRAALLGGARWSFAVVRAQSEPA
jgi:hypothetical protein